MKITTPRVVLAVAAVAALVVSTVAIAEPGPGRHGRHHRGFGAGHHGGPGGHIAHLAEKLDLTEEQRTEIRGLMEAQRDANAEQRQALRTAKQALREAVHAETFNEGAIRQASADVAALEVEQAVDRAELYQSIRQVLTPAQLEELEQLKAQRAERRAERRERRSQRWGGGDSTDGGS